MDRKKSFVLYDYREQLKLIPDDERGRLLMALMDYASDGKLPDKLSGAGLMCFAFIRQNMDRDNEKYENTCRARAASGAKGGKAKKAIAEEGKQKEAKEANAFFAKQNNPDKDHDNDNDIDKDHDNDLKKSSIGEAVPGHECRGNRIEYQYREVVAYLNEQAKTAFRDTSKDTRKCIKARFDEGYTLEDFITVIDKKVAEWGREPGKGEKDMRPFLRPATLFGSKFESYLNQSYVKKPKNSNGFHNLEEHGYDYDAMAWELSRQEGKELAE